MQVGDSLKLARDLAVRQAGELALSRYRRNVDELEEHLRNGEKILIDITAAQRNILDQKITDRSGQQGRIQDLTASSNPTKNTFSGRSTANTGVTSSASTAGRRVRLRRVIRV